MKKYYIIIPTLLVVYLLTLNFNDSLSSNNDLSLNDFKDGKLEEDTEKSNEPIMAMVSYNGETKSMSIDDYVVGVLSCEMPASFNIEALKAGAVAARTFYLYKNSTVSSYVASTNDQCFIDDDDMKVKWDSNYDKYLSIIKEAVEATSGEFLSYDGNIIQSFYFSMSNGYTENVENVFSESKPYLVSVNSSWEKELADFEKSVSFDKNNFLDKLDIENKEDVSVEILSKSSSGRVNLVSVNDKEFKGTEFRKILSLRSTDFDISIDGDEVVIVTRGYGHGVGMSQYGANAMANLGYTYKDILKYYYKGVEISII